jgi:hypothetical protein
MSLEPRQRCSDPYGGPIYQVDLFERKMFAGNGVGLPLWQINLVDGPPEQAEAWDAIFRIKEPYGQDALDADFISWVNHFSLWFVREFSRDSTADEVSATLPRYIENVIQDGILDRAFFKVEAFHVIDAGCNDPDDGEDVRAWLWDFVEYAT